MLRSRPQLARPHALRSLGAAARHALGAREALFLLRFSYFIFTSSLLFRNFQFASLLFYFIYFTLSFPILPLSLTPIPIPIPFLPLPGFPRHLHPPPPISLSFLPAPSLARRHNGRQSRRHHHLLPAHRDIPSMHRNGSSPRITLPPAPTPAPCPFPHPPQFPATSGIPIASAVEGGGHHPVPQAITTFSYTHVLSGFCTSSFPYQSTYSGKLQVSH